MSTAQNETMDQIRYILGSKDSNNLQYLIPAFKLLHSALVEKSVNTVDDALLGLLSDTGNYFITVSQSIPSDDSLLEECLVVYLQTILYLHSRSYVLWWLRIALNNIISNDNTFLEILINLFSIYWSNYAVCELVLMFLESLSKDRRCVSVLLCSGSFPTSI